MLKLAIFDMDGLLIDSERILMETIKNTCEEKGIQLNLTYYREHMGAGTPPDMKRMLPGIGNEEISGAASLIHERTREALQKMWKEGTPKKRERMR